MPLGEIQPIPESIFFFLNISNLDREDITNLLNDLVYSNSQNILAFKALINRPIRVYKIDNLEIEHCERKKYILPTPIDISTLSNHERKLFDDILSIGGSSSVGFPPMWIRGLARWPNLLPQVWMALTQINSDGRLDNMKNHTRSISDEYSSTLSDYVERIPPPETANLALNRLNKLCDGYLGLCRCAAF